MDAGIGLQHLVQGSNSSLWFTDQFKALVGRIDLSGKAVYVPTFTQNSQPSTFVQGPDSTMWFLESSANQIGAIDPSTL